MLFWYMKSYIFCFPRKITKFLNYVECFSVEPTWFYRQGQKGKGSMYKFLPLNQTLIGFYGVKWLVIN